MEALDVVSEDHRHFATNVHKQVLDLNEPRPPGGTTQTQGQPPKKVCCRCSVKIKLALILIFDIFFSVSHFLFWYFLSNFEFFRPQSGGDEVVFDKVGNAVVVFLDYEETTPDVGASKAVSEGFSDDEIEKLKFHSKFSQYIKDSSAYIETNCGDEYYKTFLVDEKEKLTHEIYQWMIQLAKICELIYLIFDAIFLALMGLCDKHTCGKIVMIFVWLTQLIPFFIYIHFLLLMNNTRFCILEFGIGSRPQTTGTIYIGTILIFYKLMLLFRTSNAYIIQIVHDKLFVTLNESENEFMDIPGPGYLKYFSEKEAMGVKQTLKVEPGTFRLIVKEAPFATPAPGTVLPPISISASNTTNATDITFPSVRGFPASFDRFFKRGPENRK